MKPPVAHDPEEFRRQGHDLVDRLADQLAAARAGRVPARPPATPLERRAEWRLRSGSDRRSAEEILGLAIDQAHQIHSPHSVGHQVAPPLPAAALADFVASFLNNSSAVFDMGPAATAMEVELIDWMGAQLGFPATRGGALVMGGSIGNLTALLAIRQAMTAGDSFREGVDGRQLCVLSSAQTHYCVRRAVQILGFGHEGLIEVPVDDCYRLDPDRLEEAFARAKALGRTPIAVVGSAASTSTGAIDPLERLADFCQEKGLWFHVDGAHGASFVLTEDGRRKLRGIERADSVVWDAHKTMLVPSLCTGVVFRDGGQLDRAFAQKADYLFSDTGPGLDLGRHTIECTKPWLGLKLWTVLEVVGERGLGDYLDGCVAVVQALAETIEESPDFECAHRPDLNILCFRHRPPQLRGAELDRHQDLLRTRVVDTTGIFLTRTVLWDHVEGRDAVWLRTTVLHPETDSEVLGGVLRALREAAPTETIDG